MSIINGVINAQKTNDVYINYYNQFQPMYSTQYPFYPQNIVYFQQYFNDGLFYQPFFTQLPTTYQNNHIFNNQLFYTLNTQPQPQVLTQTENLSSDKGNDEESTLQKSEEKKDYKKISIFKYPKKNAESNIINQIFSFLSLRGKSESILEKILEYCQEKIQNFYQVLKQLKRKNKKYINRCYIKDLVFFEQGHMGHKIIEQIRNKGSKNALTVQQFKRALRILVSYYLKTKCVSTVITSRKLDKDTMNEHLHRKREVYEYFTSQMEILRDASRY